MRHSYPSTRAVLFLRKHGIEFNPHLYSYAGPGEIARNAAAALQASDEEVFKTIVFSSQGEPLLAMVDAGHRISTHKLSKATPNSGHVLECTPRDAQRYTGYQVGGISPFGTRRIMPIYLDSAGLELSLIYVNGGSRGFMVSLAPAELIRALSPIVTDLRA